MCLVAFLAASQPLPHVPQTREGVSFTLTPYAGKAERLARHFTLPFIHNLGAPHCACGFTTDDPENAAARRHALEHLVAFLDMLTPVPSLELWVCWVGDEDTAPLQRLSFDWCELPTREDWSSERTLTALARAS